MAGPDHGPQLTSANRSAKRPFNRRSGCATCRRRKVRCDERRDVCGNCLRLNIECSWYPASELLQRSRVNNACRRCRQKKMRCTSTCSTAPCDPCQTDGEECSLARHQEHAIETETEISRHAELRRLLDAYFDGPHFFYFYTFIHRPTFQQAFDRGAIPNFLLLIVLATSLHFLDPQDSRAGKWADESRRLIMLEIFSPPSTTTLQALLLLQRYEWHRAEHMKAWILSGLAIRLTQGLQLNLEIPDETRTTVTVRETRRRLMWSCLVMESMLESGRSPLSRLNLSSIEVRLPCNENAFQLALETNMAGLDQLVNKQGHPERGPNTSHSTRPGISAFVVKLAVLRREILNYTLPYHPRNRGHTPPQRPWDRNSPFWKFEQKLEEWQANLPRELQFNDEVMYRRRPQLYSFITLHCLFHGCWCDLNRIGSYITALAQVDSPSNPLNDAPQSFLSNCRRNRLRHAFSICKVISDSMSLHGPIHDPVVAISASLAIRILAIERRAEDSIALGLTNEEVYSVLDAPIQCVKEVCRRSKPICELFCSICDLAKRNGYHIDIANLSTGLDTNSTSTPDQKTKEPGRPTSPSLRTFGTFGKIQIDIASRGDTFAPTALSPAEEDSDVFNYVDRGLRKTNWAEVPPNNPSPALSQASFPPFDMFNSSAQEMGYGWGDGTLNFSMSPVQLSWINQSLDLDFNYNHFV